MSDVKAICRRDFHAVRTSGTRPESRIRWIVLHDTEGGTAESVARFFTLPDVQGSAHLVVDDSACYRCLGNDEIPFGAPGANTQGFHIEQCGFAAWSLVLWTRHDKTLRRAAYKTAVHCRRFGIPATFRTAPELARGLKGVTTHAECTKAFGGTHSDPGRFWPRKRFMRYVRRYLAELTV